MERAGAEHPGTVSEVLLNPCLIRVQFGHIKGRMLTKIKS